MTGEVTGEDGVEIWNWELGIRNSKFHIPNSKFPAKHPRCFGHRGDLHGGHFDAVHGSAGERREAAVGVQENLVCGNVLKHPFHAADYGLRRLDVGTRGLTTPRPIDSPLTGTKSPARGVAYSSTS